MLNIIFISDKQINYKAKILINRIIVLLHENLELPNEIQIEFKELDENVYAETSLNPRYNNRITLNTKLEINDIIKPLIHELVHLEQINKGRLSKRRDGSYLYEGKVYKIKPDISYDDYLNLPWENEVVIRQPVLYKMILDKLGKQ